MFPVKSFWNQNRIAETHAMKNSASEPLSDANPSSTFHGQTWDTAAYAATGRFVADLAGPVVELLNPQPGEAILDLGCGDGELTERIAASGAAMTGVDSSPTMVAAARARGLNVYESSARTVLFDAEFDAVFSNAALHWMPDAEAVISAVYRSLKPGGRFAAEMGGQGKIAAIRHPLPAVLLQYGIDAEEIAASFYPSPTHYQRLLEAAGFTVRSIELIPRPAPLPHAMAPWLNTCLSGVLHLLPEADRGLRGEMC